LSTTFNLLEGPEYLYKIVEFKMTKIFM